MEDKQQRRKFIVALGNPGRRYAGTRHNTGWMVLAELRRRWGLGSGRGAFGGLVYQAAVPDKDGLPGRVTLLEPLTYMNRSGEAVKGLLGFYKAEPSDLLVILDDLALPLGRVRARPGGTDGGHNGLKDVIRLLGTEDVPRLRVGIGRPPAQVDMVDYVLSAFREEERPAIEQAISTAANAAEDWTSHDIGYVMDKYNPNKTPNEGA